jgi:hypothetical protein
MRFVFDKQGTMEARMRKFGVAGLIVFLLSVTATGSGAVVLLPGSAELLAGTSSASRPELAGTVIVDDLKSFTGIDSYGNIWFSGDLQVRIVREDISGTLDFYYKISNSAGSLDGIERISLSDFTGWDTDVDWRIDGLGSVAPSYADRQLSGGTVSFNFTNFPGTPGLVAPGSESRFIFIKTNATSYTAGSAVLIDGGIASVRAYAPALPEAGALFLFGTGLIGLVGYRRVRRMQ